MFAKSKSAPKEKGPLKIVIVGDDLNSSKRQLLKTYTQLNSSNISTLSGDVSIKIKINIESIVLNLCDIQGQEEYDRLRPIYYNNANLFMLLFDITDQDSFNNITGKWYPELQHCSPDTPIVLIGLINNSFIPVVTDAQIKDLITRLGLHKYFPCDLTNKPQVKDIFTICIKELREIPDVPFFNNFSSKKEIHSHFFQVFEIAKARRRKGTYFSPLPMEILLCICNFLGNHLTEDKTALDLLNILLLNNVLNSKQGKLIWHTSLQINDKVIPILPKSKYTKQAIWKMPLKIVDNVKDIVMKNKNKCSIM